MAASPEIEFEREVRRIARLLWPDAAHGGAQMIAGRERDGVFESADEVHIIECTTSRSREKAIQDTKKLKEAIKFWEGREPTKSAKGWFVTKEDVTADQATIVRDSRARIVGVSFDQFRAKLVNAKEYLDLRGKYPFGSVADPETGNAVTEIKYVELNMVDTDENGTLLIQRLPGLGVNNPEDGTRKFIDIDFASVAAAGDVFRFIADPFTYTVDDSTWQASLPSIGIETVAHRCHSMKFADGKLSSAINKASAGKPPHTLCADIVRTMAELSMSYKGSVTTLRDMEIPEIIFYSGDSDLHDLVFQGALIGVLEISPEVVDGLLPTFSGCYFGSIEGRTGRQDLPNQIDQECIVDKFDDTAATTSAILRLELPVGTKVLLTILKKLYVQKGAGRRQSALYRGLDHKSQSVVADVLKLLQKEGFITLAHYTDQIVWLPVRSAEIRRRALRILGAPNECHDHLVSLSSKIG